MSYKTVMRAVLLPAAGAWLAGTAMSLRKRRVLALATADKIEGQLAALDPATRADVIAKLGRHAVATARRDAPRTASPAKSA